MVKAWARSRIPQAACDEDSPPPCGVPLHTDVQLHWPSYECGLSFASRRALMAHSTATHATVSFDSRFVFDVYCPCCLTLFHTRQRVREHSVDGKPRCLQALTASVEPASDALVQQLLDRSDRVEERKQVTFDCSKPFFLLAGSVEDRSPRAETARPQHEMSIVNVSSSATER